MVNRHYGSPDVLKLEEIDRPVIKDGQVLVRVRAAAVNPPDWAGVHGEPYIVRLAFGVRRPGSPSAAPTSPASSRPSAGA